MGIGWDGYRLGWLNQGNTPFQRLTLALEKKTTALRQSAVSHRPWQARQTAVSSSPSNLIQDLYLDY